MKPDDSAPESTPTPAGVLDPSWEDALRAGQEEDGGAGSVEGELAVLHLLRHVRAPEHLPEAALEQVWRDVDGAITPTPWWRRSWVLWGAPVAVAAAALFVVLRGPGDIQPGGELPGESGGQAQPMVAMSITLEQQFAALEPEARSTLNHRVDDGRGALRGRLLARSLAAAAPTPAPATATPPVADPAPAGGNR